MKHTLDSVLEAQSIVLSTHKQCDGDGVGSQVALFHALKRMNKKVRILNVDGTPPKYHFILPHGHIEYFDDKHSPLEKTDLAIIVDTNDYRMVEPLYSEMKKQCRQILFIDHHPLLTNGPHPTTGSIINTKAASTGEMVFDLIQKLGVSLDANISTAIYTSVVFDTHIFRYIRSSPRTHEICAQLLHHIEHPEEVHRHLFGTYTVDKMTFLSQILGQIEYFMDGRLAILCVSEEDMLKHDMLPDESRDVIDFLMNIASLEAAAFFRQDGPNHYKLSLRSKGRMTILPVAEALGGGGHLYAAGAFAKGNYNDLKASVLKLLKQRMEELPIADTASKV